jgi:hypothetical protein
MFAFSPQRATVIAQERNHQAEVRTFAHRHHCSSLFGCGDENGPGILREDIKESATDRHIADRLLHRDEVDQQQLDDDLSARGRRRRQLLQASSFMGARSTVGPGR